MQETTARIPTTDHRPRIWVAIEYAVSSADASPGHVETLHDSIVAFMERWAESPKDVYVRTEIYDADLLIPFDDEGWGAAI